MRNWVKIEGCDEARAQGVVWPGAKKDTITSITSSRRDEDDLDLMEDW